MASRPKIDAGRMLDALLRNRGRVKIPQVGDLAAEFINSMGGVRDFSAQLVTEFKAAPAGSMQRAKILDMVMRGLKASEADLPDVGRLDTADLRRLLTVQLAQLEEETGAELSTGPAAERPQADPGEAVRGADAEAEGSAGPPEASDAGPPDAERGGSGAAD